MPREVKRYLCDFRCHTPAKSKREAMEAHEAICLKNPAVKACTTCAHEIYYKDGEDHSELPGCPPEEWIVRSCKKLTEEAFDTLREIQGIGDSFIYIPPIKNCPYWEGK